MLLKNLIEASIASKFRIALSTGSDDELIKDKALLVCLDFNLFFLGFVIKDSSLRYEGNADLLSELLEI